MLYESHFLPRMPWRILCVYRAVLFNFPLPKSWTNETVTFLPKNFNRCLQPMTWNFSHSSSFNEFLDCFIINSEPHRWLCIHGGIFQSSQRIPFGAFVTACEHSEVCFHFLTRKLIYIHSRLTFCSLRVWMGKKVEPIE